MLSKCQLVLATGGTVAQDLTMPWSTLSGFMQDLTLMVIDEGQQYGTDREIATISLLKQQPLILWNNPLSFGQGTHSKHRAELLERPLMPRGHASSYLPKNTGFGATETTICLPTWQKR